MPGRQAGSEAADHANPFPAAVRPPAQSGQASRWRGAINNCIKIYDVLYGGEREREGGENKKGEREKLTSALSSYFSVANRHLARQAVFGIGRDQLQAQPH
jgi:hypothetical protein